jgi:phosphate transport system substrate-binding protein
MNNTQFIFGDNCNVFESKARAITVTPPVGRLSLAHSGSSLPSLLRKRVGAAVSATFITTAMHMDAQTLLSGAGATFPYPIYSKWIGEYQEVHPDVQIRYQPIGSGAGILEITGGTIDFGASDGPMNDGELESFRTKHKMEILHFPTVLGADVPIYNLPDTTTELKFTPEVLAGIFLGKISKWNDPQLAKINPDANLPDRDILVVSRSDGSGTTYVWTDYLAKVSEEWRTKIGFGTWVQWPVGVSAGGNEGVSAMVKQTPYSIGYVELAYALKSKLSYGLVKNKAGNYVKADLDSVGAAAELSDGIPSDFRLSITNAPGEKAYPIASFTWLLVPEKFADKNKLKAMKDFLGWILTDGQKLTRTLEYAPLPTEMATQEQQALIKLRETADSAR